MFLSLVAAPMSGQRMAALTRELYLQRFNVAASRAQDQMWLFHSMRLEDLPNKEDMRYQLLDYCLRVPGALGDIGRDRLPDTVSDVEQDPRFDSLFEQHVYNLVTARGYLVIPQYDAHGYKIDLVVVGARSRLGIECDGEFWHGPEQYEHDFARQRELQRCGWTFSRIRGSAFYRDPEVALEALWDLLDAHDIHPAGWTPPPPLPRPDLLLPTTAAQPPADEISDTEIDEETDAEEEGSDEQETQPATFRGPSSPMRAARARRPGGDYGLEPFVAWRSHRLPDPRTATRTQLVDGLVKIVEAEGPVVGDRAYRLFVQAAGGQRVAKQSTHALNQAAAYAVRRGSLASVNPTGATGQKAQTLYIPGSSEVVLRRRGDRDLDEMPPAEVAELMRRIIDDVGAIADEALFREVLGTYDLVRLTTRAETFLRSCRSLL